MIKEFTRVLSLEIDKEVELVMEHLKFGRCRGHDEYKHLTGEIQGLLRAKEHLLALAKRAETDDDD